MASDWTKLRAALKEASFEVELSKRGGHYAVYDQSGQRVATLPASPSDHHTWLNTLAVLRRHANFDYRPKQTRKKKED